MVIIVWFINIVCAAWLVHNMWKARNENGTQQLLNLCGVLAIMLCLLIMWFMVILAQHALNACV